MLHTVSGNRFVWKVETSRPEEVDALCHQWGLSRSSPVDRFIAHILWRRQVRSRTEAENFLQPSLRMLHSPFRLPDMDRAVQVFYEYIFQQKKPVYLVGDYDVDGTTSLGMLSLFLRMHQIPHEVYIPHRTQEGYGFSVRALQDARRMGFSFLILVDLGTTDHSLIHTARQEGMTVIVLDHHQVGEENFPHPADAFVNPHRPDSQYPFLGLSAGGLVFKFLHALHLRYGVEIPWEEMLILTTLSICADVVPVLDENRALVSEGLKRMADAHTLPGIRLLLELAGFRRKIPTVWDVAFLLAPRLNSAGRMRHAREAFHLLVASSEVEAQHWAQRLHLLNHQRRQLNARIDAEIHQRLAQELAHDPPVVILKSPHWSRAVVGINASRLAERIHRPVILLAEEPEGVLAGSGRSIPGIDLYRLVSQCRHLLLEFGGHEYAIGVTLLRENFERFRQCLYEIFQQIYRELPPPELEVEAPVSLQMLEEKTMWEALQRLEPFGPGNPIPVVSTFRVRESGKSRIIRERHFLLSLLDPYGYAGRMIAFDQPHLQKVLVRRQMDVAFQLHPRGARLIDFHLYSRPGRKTELFRFLQDDESALV